MKEPTPSTFDTFPGANGEFPPTSAPKVGFVVIYRWRVHPDLEAEFVAAWSMITAFLKSERGSLGARLHRGQDGIWYSYAQWPTAAARDAAFSHGGVDEGAMATMNRAVAEFLPEILLSPVADQLGWA
jgi:Antibiotic biosynthesis monooxygenase.